MQKDLLSKYSSGLFSAGGQAKTGDLLDKKTIGGSPNQYMHCDICAVCIVPLSGSSYCEETLSLSPSLLPHSLTLSLFLLSFLTVSLPLFLCLTLPPVSLSLLPTIPPSFLPQMECSPSWTPTKRSLLASKSRTMRPMKRRRGKRRHYKRFVTV